MARRRTPLPTGFYIVERDAGAYTPYHQVDDMMFYAGGTPGALVPIGPSFSSYLLAARFIYERAGIPWASRKRGTGGAGSQTSAATHGGGGQSSETNTSGVLSDGMEKRPRTRTTQKRHSGGSASSLP